MSEIPGDLKYAKTHEWAKLEEGGVVRIGITDFAQEELGDLVYVELPEIGRRVSVGEACAVVESVKTASDLYSPVAGVIEDVNASVADHPEAVNDDAYGTWLFCVRADDPAELDALMDAERYEALVGEQ